MAHYDLGMRDHLYLQRVQEHIQSGTRSKVRSTQAFFVNAVLHDVSVGLEELQRTAESTLASSPAHKARR